VVDEICERLVDLGGVDQVVVVQDQNDSPLARREVIEEQWKYRVDQPRPRRGQRG
jgi:hypothetical protein